MINAESCFHQSINAPVRSIKARVELYDGSTLVDTFHHNDRLVELTIERAPETNKFFGYGICQKLNIKLIDNDGDLDISTINSLDVAFGTNSDYVYVTPEFRVTECHRDEKSGQLSVTAYDAIYKATSYTVSDLPSGISYDILEFARSCARLIGAPLKLENVPENDFLFGLVFELGANFNGTETIRYALDAIADATQTIYYMNSDWELVFRRLDIDGDALFELTPDNYTSLKTGTNRRITTVVHATELGDSVFITTGESGSTVYVRDNPFWELRDDIDLILEKALENVGGMTINQFDCQWRGNYLVEIGDKVEITTKESKKVNSFLLNDTLVYDGALSQKSEWSYEDSEAESDANPVTLGDALRQTSARVDKVNQNIELVAKDTSTNAAAISSLQLDTNSINASVQSMKKNTETSLGSLSDDIAVLNQKVEAQITAEDVELSITKALENGVDRVETTTGFTFNDEGLTVSKTNSEMTTTITEDGMTVYRNSASVLVADNEGVKAEDLHATTFLIIGNNSRFEDYNYNRTGCFWIGG